MTDFVDEMPTPSDWIWKGVRLIDVEELDFECLIAGSTSADANEISDVFRQAGMPETPNALMNGPVKVYVLIAAVTGMHFRPHERYAPYGPMLVMDGNRSPIPSDFSSDIEPLLKIALKARHPALRARFCDVCWLLDRSKHEFARQAIEAYVEIVSGAIKGTYLYRFARSDDGDPLLQRKTRDLLRRALWIAKGCKASKGGEFELAQALVVEARERAAVDSKLTSLIWFSELDLEHRISDPTEVSQLVEAVLSRSQNFDYNVVTLWQLAARGFHKVGKSQDKDRCLIKAAECYIGMAESQTHSAMIASSHLSDAIAQLKGIPSQKPEELKYSADWLMSSVVFPMR